jgi:hypothetical protein
MKAMGWQPRSRLSRDAPSTAICTESSIYTFSFSMGAQAALRQPNASLGLRKFRSHVMFRVTGRLETNFWSLILTRSQISDRRPGHNSGQPSTQAIINLVPQPVHHTSFVDSSLLRVLVGIEHWTLMSLRTSAGAWSCTSTACSQASFCSAGQYLSGCGGGSDGSRAACPDGASSRISISGKFDDLKAIPLVKTRAGGGMGGCNPPNYCKTIKIAGAASQSPRLAQSNLCGQLEF